MELVIPIDRRRSTRARSNVEQAAYRAQLAELKRASRASPVHVSTWWSDLTDEERTFVGEGDGAYHGIRASSVARAQEVQGAREGFPEPLSRVSCMPRLRRRRGSAARRATSASAIGRCDSASALTFARRSSSSRRGSVKKRRCRDNSAARGPEQRLSSLSDVGLDYLSLDVCRRRCRCGKRSASTWRRRSARRSWVRSTC